jgi:hypothetical protein
VTLVLQTVQVQSWCSTDQGSKSTSTAESEIKAVNHTLKSEIIANRGILNAMGWIIEEDNIANTRWMTILDPKPSSLLLKTQCRSNASHQKGY